MSVTRGNVQPAFGERVDGLDGTLASYHETAKAALVRLDATDQSERVVDAIRATADDTVEDIAEMEADEAVTRVPSTYSATNTMMPTGG
jgi:hypothetical protein